MRSFLVLFPILAMATVAPAAQAALPDRISIVAHRETWATDDATASSVFLLGTPAIPRSLDVVSPVLLLVHPIVDRSGSGGSDPGLTGYQRRAPPIATLVP